jgi:hypothetical protein
MHNKWGWAVGLIVNKHHHQDTRDMLDMLDIADILDIVAMLDIRDLSLSVFAVFGSSSFSPCQIIIIIIVRRST